MKSSPHTYSKTKHILSRVLDSTGKVDSYIDLNDQEKVSRLIIKLDEELWKARLAFSKSSDIDKEKIRRAIFILEEDGE